MEDEHGGDAEEQCCLVGEVGDDLFVVFFCSFCDLEEEGFCVYTVSVPDECIREEEDDDHHDGCVDDYLEPFEDEVEDDDEEGVGDEEGCEEAEDLFLCRIELARRKDE